jgi:3-oxoacyl-[acyl-carrier protein] reductase
VGLAPIGRAAPLRQKKEGTVRFADKVALVTGASRGMGREIALAFAREGADLVLAARTVTQADERFPTRPGTITQVAAEVCSLGRRALPMRCDVSVRSDVEALIDQAIKEFGQIDIVVNSAWTVAFKASPLDDLMRSEVSDSTIGTFKGIVDITRAVLPHMRSRRYGKIINITSVGGKTKVANAPVYAGLKAGVAHFSRCVSAVVASEGITVNCVAPGIIDTPSTYDSYPGLEGAFKTMIPARRLGTESEVARAVLFLADDDSSYITGVTLSVDGGMTDF